MATEQLTRFKKWEILTKTQAENIQHAECERQLAPVSGVFPPLEFCK